MFHCLGAIEPDYFLFFVGQFLIEDLQDVSAFHYAGRLYWFALPEWPSPSRVARLLEQ